MIILNFYCLNLMIEYLLQKIRKRGIKIGVIFQSWIYFLWNGVGYNKFKFELKMY